MSKLCQHIKANGQYCAAWAIWASEPPRCPTHRLDGGPQGVLLPKGNAYSWLGPLTHGFYSLSKRLGLHTLEDETAACLIVHQRLSALIAGQPDVRLLVHLYRVYGRNLGHLLKKLYHYHQETGHHPDKLLQQARTEGIPHIQAKLAPLLAQRDAHFQPNYPKTAKRSPRYWQLYDYIVAYIERHSVGPTHREIQKACDFPSLGQAICYWLDRLEQDGLITREAGRTRNIRLAGQPPLAPRLPLFDDEPLQCIRPNGQD